MFSSVEFEMYGTFRRLSISRIREDDQRSPSRLTIDTESILLWTPCQHYVGRVDKTAQKLFHDR